ncbi:hypothetical protein HPB51_025656 [Rhipicephalus microplus]|uniref:Uncharacterized protein n=1 Tax=Rhipicephalus microplus TaxID=6941 RepID=A0A9J6DKA7_RHIMP|nr:hypothetical protein HPB51_025656 [Rhipicephalus microplus]
MEADEDKDIIEVMRRKPEQEADDIVVYEVHDSDSECSVVDGSSMLIADSSAVADDVSILEIVDSHARNSVSTGVNVDPEDKGSQPLYRGSLWESAVSVPRDAPEQLLARSVGPGSSVLLDSAMASGLAICRSAIAVMPTSAIQLLLRPTELMLNQPIELAGEMAGENPLPAQVIESQIMRGNQLYAQRTQSKKTLPNELL